MALNIIGIGLCDERDISLKGLDLCKSADKIFLESYTNLLQVPVQRLEVLYGKPVHICDRDAIEKHIETLILEPAQHENVCLLVIGEVFSATTHADLYLRAQALGIQVNVVHNASIFSAIGATGLQVYKFGKVTSIPFDHEHVSTPYQYLQQNRGIGAHTLFLLDLDPIAGKYLSIVEAIEYLHRQETIHGRKLISSSEKFLACARLGSPDQMIRYGTIKELAPVDFGHAPYCLILPGTLHFAEEDMLENWRV